MDLSNAEPCYLCKVNPIQTPYGKCVMVGCGNMKCKTVGNNAVEDTLEQAVKAWNKEQKRLTALWSPDV